MRNVKTKRVVLGVILSSVFAVANSASITLQSQVDSVTVGQQFAIDLSMDFSDEATIGGGIDIHYDALVANFVSFDFDSAFLLLSDPALTCPGGAACSDIDQPDVVQNIVFGSFSGIGGQHTIGTLIFELTGLGQAAVLPQTTTGTGGPFVSANTFQPMSVVFSGIQIDGGAITGPGPGPGPSPVPLPASIWLLGSGLGVLLAKARLARKGV